MPGKARSAGILHRVRASGCRYGRFKAVIRSGPRLCASRACGKSVDAGLRVHQWRRMSSRRSCCPPRRPDFAHREGVQPLMRWALRTGGPLQHPLKRSVRPRRTRPRLRSWGPHPRERSDLPQRNDPSEADQGSWRHPRRRSRARNS